MWNIKMHCWSIIGYINRSEVVLIVLDCRKYLWHTYDIYVHRTGICVRIVCSIFSYTTYFILEIQRRILCLSFYCQQQYFRWRYRVLIAHFVWYITRRTIVNIISIKRIFRILVWQKLYRNYWNRILLFRTLFHYFYKILSEVFCKRYFYFKSQPHGSNI